MRNITYKYNVGDTVVFKSRFIRSTCGLVELAGTKAEVEATRDYNGPAYKLKDHEGWFKENCFAGKVR